MYDAIVIGARCAGGPTAMLLARQGLRVLLVDKARVLGDVISTHFLHPRGCSYLQRWGLLSRVLATGAPPWERHQVTLEDISLAGHPTVERMRERLGACHGWRRRDELGCAVIKWCAPRRHVLDRILAEAAAEAGAELRLGFAVEELLTEGDRVVGVRGHDESGRTVTEKAQVVVGADGQRSLVARRVEAPSYHVRLKCTYAYYTYWSGVSLEGLKWPLHFRGRLGMAAYPTNGHLLHLVVWGPREWFHAFRTDVPGNYLRTVAFVYPELAERLSRGRREERIYGTADQPNGFRKPHGAGWALVGDAGFHKDQNTAIGMTHAFRDSELLADAIGDGLSGRRPLDEALAEYAKRRDEDSITYYNFVCTLAECNPPRLQEEIGLFTALRGNQDHINEFLGTFGDVVRPEQFFAPENMQHVFQQARGDLPEPAIVKSYAQRIREYVVNPWVSTDASRSAPAS